METKMTTVLRGSEFTTIAGTAANAKPFGATQMSDKVSLISRRNMRRNRRAVRAI
jgi:hypothetical protein